MVFHAPKRQNPPAFNIPKAVLVLAAVIVLVHLVREYVLTGAQDFWLIMTFAFIPARYGLDPAMGSLPPGFAFPGGLGADIWSYVSYAFLHGDWTHLVVNLLWMIAFGSAVARRFRAWRFLALSMAATVGGAVLHQAFHFGDFIPMIGASAAVSGQMGAAIRFAFTGPRPLIGAGTQDETGKTVPAVGLIAALGDRRVLAFIVVWFAINIIFGTGVVSVPGVEASIAWQAHVGGFLVGLLGFALFDPISPSSR